MEEVPLRLMPDRIDLDRVGRVLASVCETQGLSLDYADPSTGEVTVVDRDAAAAADGLLPIILVSAEAIWREATGRGFAIDLEADADAILGYRVTGMANVPFTVVMLCIIHALSLVTKGRVVALAALAPVTKGALQRSEVAGNLLRTGREHDTRSVSD